MLTIFVPTMYITDPNGAIIMSTILFFSGIYLTALYFIMLFYKDSRDKALKDYQTLKKEFDLLKEKVDS